MRALTLKKTQHKMTMTTPEQLAFDLPRFHAAGLDDFMVSPSNEPALNQVLETPGPCLGGARGGLAVERAPRGFGPGRLAGRACA